MVHSFEVALDDLEAAVGRLREDVDRTDLDQLLDQLGVAGGRRVDFPLL